MLILRLLLLLKIVQGNAVIPSKHSGLQPRLFDKQLSQVRHLIELFLCQD